MILTDIETFFTGYAADLASGVGERIAAAYDLPSFMLMTAGTPGRPVTDHTELAASFSAASQMYRQHGFGDPVARVTRAESLTPTITLAWVTWDYRDTAGAPIYEADYLYVLRASDGRTVIACVCSINEQERVATWLASRTNAPSPDEPVHRTWR